MQLSNAEMFLKMASRKTLGTGFIRFTSRPEQGGDLGTLSLNSHKPNLYRCFQAPESSLPPEQRKLRRRVNEAFNLAEKLIEELLTLDPLIEETPRLEVLGATSRPVWLTQ